MKTVLIIIYVIVALVLTVLTLMQSKDDDGMSAAITGGSFYEKNKGRTKEGKIRREESMATKVVKTGVSLIKDSTVIVG